MTSAYRLAWGLWIAFGAIYIAAYSLMVHNPRGATPGFLLASLLLQAILVPAHIRPQQFASRLQALIRSIAAGVGAAGIALCLSLLGPALSAHGTRSEPDAVLLRYGSTILVLAGLAGGAQLGLLRWKLLQQGLAPTVVEESNRRRYLHSAAVWIAVVTVCAWLPAPRAAGTFGYLGFLVGSSGLLLIAPIPLMFPAARTGPSLLVWRYFRRSIVVLLGTWALAVLLSFGAKSLLAVYLIGSFPYLLLLLVPCFLWALCYGLAEHPREPEPKSAPAPARPGIVALGIVVPLSLALAAGLFATAPASLGRHGVGCRNTYDGIMADYWFWQAWKGVGSQYQTPDTMVFRPAGLPHACVVLDRHDVALFRDAVSRSLGYAEAARTWFWLIDPKDWNGSRTIQIRRELTRLLGREFSSYRDLEAWWNLNGEQLVWAGGSSLEVHEPTTEELAHLYTYRNTHPLPPPSAVEAIRSSPHLASTDAAEESGQFRAALLDPEVRLRGLTLAAEDQIAILTGERDRLAREYVQGVTGQKFGTAAEWQHFFAQEELGARWRMSRAAARQWIAMIHVNGANQQYRSMYLRKLGEETGVAYPTLEAFLAWLQNPENTRRDEWTRARELADQIVDSSNRTATDRLATGWLTQITGQSFATREEWIQWWNAHRATLTLSPDGHTLVASAK